MNPRTGFPVLSLLIAAALISGCGLASGNAATKVTFANSISTVKTQQISAEGKSMLEAYLMQGNFRTCNIRSSQISALRRKNFTNPLAIASVDYGPAAFGAGSCFDSSVPASAK